MLTIIRLTIEANKIAEVDTIADANTTVKAHVALRSSRGGSGLATTRSSTGLKLRF